MTAKQVVQELLETLPDTCTYEEIRRQIECFENLRRTEEAVMMGAHAGLELEIYLPQ